MTLEKIQKVLALIYTDKHFRETFFAEAVKIGNEYGLSQEEITKLAGLSISRINFFADSLKHKRLLQIYKLLPLLHKVLGKEFIPLFMDYADTYVPEGLKKYQEDAFRFADYLKKTRNEIKLKFPWLSDLADYEAIFLKTWNSDAKLKIQLFRYPVNEIIKQIINNENISVELKLNIIIWYRFRKDGKLRQIILP